MAITYHIFLIWLLTQITSTISTFNLTTDDIPMFLTITFDGVLDEHSYNHTEQILQHQNRNDKDIPLVFFINNDIEYMKNYSDYSVIQERYLQGCEIAIHTATHTTLWDTNINKWYYEINRSRALISQHAAIPMENLIGFRTALFDKQKPNILNQVLHGLNPSFLYDSSSINNTLNTNTLNWPYTLNNYSIYEKDLWEMTIYDLDAITNNSFVDELTYIFQHRYNSNRSPINLRFNLTWLEDNSHIAVLNNFIEWVLKQENTWFVTNQQLIEWINNPIINSEYNGPIIGNNNTLINDETNPTNFTFCEYLEGNFDTAQEECPESWPYVNEWKINDLVYTEINITTTAGNINKEYIYCHNNSYEIYDSETEYCSTDINAKNKNNIIEYEGKLYSCQWWTKPGELPGKTDAWVFVKDCNGIEDPFMKGSIVPYGIVNVFIQNELHIYIQAYDGYDMDFITVIVEDNTYNLSIFDDYIINHTQSNEYELIVRFDEIKLAKYEIKISFKSDTIRASFIATIMYTICWVMSVN